jgi:dihydrofolate synthase/folylpolyglutamate synthase
MAGKKALSYLILKYGDKTTCGRNTFAAAMDYQQTLNYLYHTLPMFSHAGSAAIKKDLTNITALCAHLGNPQQHFRSIHIGGTNGKGSVSHMLAAVLQTAGYKTGLYTSPHLYDFRERIRINGAVIEETFVVDFVQKLKPQIEEIKPSFFEITVAMAFQYFAEQCVDTAVIEVGLGGRLDSTNIITPELAVITNISWDHMNLLGDTLEAIAGEKAGIIKEGIPVVVGERDQATAAVFERAAVAKKAPLYFASDAYGVSHFTVEADALQVEIWDSQHGVLKKFVLDLPGIYQTRNLLTVIQATEILKNQGYRLDGTGIAQALQQTKRRTGLKGRWDVVHCHPTVVLDVAHNEAGIAQMLAHLRQLKYQTLHLVIGMVKDKDIEQVLRLLPPSAIYYFTQAHIPRALDATLLQQKAAQHNLPGGVYNNVNTALQHALQQATADDIILVCGSIFLVAEVSTNLFNT